MIIIEIFAYTATSAQCSYIKTTVMECKLITNIHFIRAVKLSPFAVAFMTRSTFVQNSPEKSFIKKYSAITQQVSIFCFALW